MLTTPVVISPSIGGLGICVDYVNNRVKALFDQIFTSTGCIQDCLCDNIGADNEAVALLTNQMARFTARVITPKDLVPTISPFAITSGLIVHEEARITSRDYELIYIGGNQQQRFDQFEFDQERRLAAACTSRQPSQHNTVADFQRIRTVTDRDVAQLLEIYHACFRSYLVPLDEQLIRMAAANSIFWVARNQEGRIVASAIGESLRLGPLTLLEISEVAAHPAYRVRGAATGCVKRVVDEGKSTLTQPVVAFMEARMWENILGMSQSVGLNSLAGILHQHCVISTPSAFNSIRQEAFGSLAVCYSSI